MHLDFPLRVDHRGRTAECAYESHLRHLMAQVLFTSPGERVNRPTFGSGVLQVLFQPLGTELAATTQFLVQSALQQWLGHLIRVEGVEVEHEEATLTITVRYVIIRTQQRETARFSRGGPQP
jgi:phage baseplate assembly protein W